MEFELLAISKSIRENRCLVFIGSGVAANAGLLTAQDLKEFLGRELPGDTSTGSLQKISQSYMTIHSERALKKTIQQHLQMNRETTPLDLSVYNLISQIPGINFVTTNWDTILEDHFKPSQIQTMFLDSEVHYWDKNRQNILKMHGCVRCPSSIVVSRSHYESYESTHPNFVRKLKELLIENTLVICGYSLDDRTFRDIYRSAQKNGPESEQIYWVDPYAPGLDVSEWKQNGINHLHATAYDFFTALSKTLETKPSETSLKSNNNQHLTRLFKELLQTEQDFKVLTEPELFEYEEFREKTEVARVQIIRYCSEASKVIPNIRASQVQDLKKQIERVNMVPIAIGTEVNKKYRSLQLHNPESVKILVRDLMESTAGKLQQLKNITLQREENLTGKIFAKATEPNPTRALRESLTRLVSSRGFAEFYEFIGILSERSIEIADFIAAAPDEDSLSSHLLKYIWRHFDIVLVNELSKDRSIRSRLLRITLEKGGQQTVRSLSFILALFSQQHAKVISTEDIVDEARKHSKDRHGAQVILRCLTFHPYSSAIRKTAISAVDGEALWTLLSLKHYPLWALPDASQHLLSNGSTDAAKLILDVKYKDITDTLDAPSVSDADLDNIEGFLLALKGSSVLMLESYYDKYAELVQKLVTMLSGRGTDQLLEVVQGIQGDFQRFAAAPPGESTFRKLPKYTKTKLADNILYFKYFATSTDYEIASLVQPCIKDTGFAANVLKNKNVNGSLVRWISEQGHLMQSYLAKKSLLMNPKAPLSAARQFIPHMSPKDLKAISHSREVNPQVRQLALHRART